MNSAIAVQNIAVGERLKTCQISVVKNMTREKNSSSGTARTRTGSAVRSCVKNRAPVQRTIDSSPNPTTRYGRRRSPG